MAGPPPTAYLKDGPCGGTTRKLTAAELRNGTLTCKGATYNHTDTLHGEDVVFEYQSPTSGGGTGVTPLNDTRAHKGWADLQRSLNQKWHPALIRSERLTRDALRSLSRTHKVKG